ncbi:energy transducer TonB [Microvirga arabica]|uniref:Energy transducer TonB n=1 Tax=Microvirga arabica TaxID=1128671 RepID=A0ABV6Y944_9HYPH
MRSLRPAALMFVLMGAIPAQALSKSEKTALVGILVDRIARCYSPAPGQIEAVVIKLHLERNGGVADLQVLEPQPNSEANQAVIRAAERAIRRCAHFEIPAKFAASYDLWKHVTIQFDR